ncbi:MAG: radical SAM protein [bacterium]|jgi:hypothetical protein
MTTQPIEYAPHGRQLNPAELEIDLFCKGIRIHESCHLDQDARDFVRARAGLGSGLELMIPGRKNIWLNAPVTEFFVPFSPYELRFDGNGYQVYHTQDDVYYEVILPPAPAWYNKKTSTGVRMKEIAVMQGTYLGVYVGGTCAFWLSEPRESCKFCATGLHVGTEGADKAFKKVDEVVEVAQEAKRESNISFVHFNTGFQKNRGLELCAPFVKAMKERVGALVGVQAIPSPDLWKYDWMIDCGANHFSFCYELHNPEYFEKFLPGKARHIRQETFFRAMEYTSRKLGKGAVSGEIIAGIEPIEDTLNAIDYITSIGAFPTVCIFRPVEGTDMQDWNSPRYEDMVVVFKHVYEACMKNGIPIGMAPNIEVSLVVQPNDAEYLVEPSLRYYWYKTKLAVMRSAAQFIFQREMKPHPVAADADHAPVPPVIQNQTM